VENAVRIRRLAHGDANAILAIQSQCPELAPWSGRDYEAMTDGKAVGWVAELVAGDAGEDAARPDSIAGFITARVAADEIEILNLGVAPDARRHGIATALLKAAMAWGTENHARKAFLEVRVSNSAAIRFYERAGFQAVGRRAKYYTSPIEDALQLVAKIG
jgi:[ribosomal protein S18]-alanine N-acetyltransferase